MCPKKLDGQLSSDDMCMDDGNGRGSRLLRTLRGSVGKEKKGFAPLTHGAQAEGLERMRAAD